MMRNRLLVAVMLVGASTSAHADDLVLDAPPTAPLNETNADFREELEELVQHYLAGAPWGPWYRNANVHSRLYYWAPHETVLAFSQALPYLPEAQRLALVQNLDAFMERHNPLMEAHILQNAAGPVPQLGAADNAGRWRGFAPAPPPPGPAIGYNLYPYPTVHGFALYAVWAYAHYASRESFVEANWNGIQALYREVKGTPQGAQLWAQTGAMIGAARLAQMHGDTAMMQEAAGFAREGLQAAVGFAEHAARYDDTGGERVQTFDLALINYSRGADGMGDGKIALGLPREVLRAIGNNVFGRQEMKDYLAVYAHKNDYTYGYLGRTLSTRLIDWSATEHGGFSASEGGALVPEISWAFFLMHAYALGTNQDTLRPHLDAPWCRADLMQVDKLVAAIEAVPGSSAPPDPTDTSRPSSSTPTRGSQEDKGCACHGAALSFPPWLLGVLAAWSVQRSSRRRR